MPSQTVLISAMPRALSIVGDTLPVSVLVSPRLSGSRTLEAFPDWMHWTQRLKDNGFALTVTVNGKAIPVRIDTAPLRPDLWAALFSADTLVNDYEFDDYGDRTVISYPVRDAMLAVKAVYQTVAKELGLPADPSDRESAPRRSAVLTQMLDGMQLDEWSDVHRQRLREVFGKRLDRPTHRRRARPAAPVGADGLPSAAQLSQGSDLQQLKRQVALEFALYSRMPAGAPITKPDMDTLLDFHKVISALSAYPDLMRALGLVFDLDLSVDGVPLTNASQPGRLAVALDDGSWNVDADSKVCLVGDTACHYLQAEDGRRYWFTASGSEGERGRITGLLDLDPDAYCLAQFDVDGAMHKLMMLAAAVPSSGSRLAPALHPEKYDDANTVPALRSAGLSLVHDERARAFLASIAASRKFNERVLGNPTDDAPLFAEDLVRGYRLDVWNSFDGQWHSLHRRSGRYAFEGVEFNTTHEEGYVQLAAMQPAPDPALIAPINDLYLHESMVRWNGWSQSVPPPGKAISRNPDPDKAVPPDDPSEREPDDRQNEPVTPFQLKASFKVAPQSLPALRFGRCYRLRARVVDLAGNSMAFDDPLANDIAQHFAIPRDPAGFAYLRYEPVPAPQIVRRDDLAITGRGSALDRLVIRTYNADPSLDTAAANLAGSQRHIVPPRGSLELAERHGMLDDGNGHMKGDAATWQMLVERDAEISSQFPRAPVPGQQESLPILVDDEAPVLSYVPDPLARRAALRDLPGAPQHVFGNATATGIDYVPLGDPNPRSGSVTHISFENAPDWLQARGFLLALDEGQDLPAWDAGRHRLTVHLPKGSSTVVTLSSATDTNDLKLLGLWQWMREYLIDLAGAKQIRFRNNPAQEEIAVLLQRATEGGLWMLTPPTLLTLVSAVQQPLGRPRFEALAVQRTVSHTRLQPLALSTRKHNVGGKQYDPTPEQMDEITAWREPGALDARLIGALRVHGQTTAKVDLYAEWDEWLDDPTRPDIPPVHETRSGFVDTLPLNDPQSDRTLMAAGGTRAVGVYDATQNLIGFTTGGDVFGRDPALNGEADAAPRHYLGDTRHRRIRYRAVATSRYREYFPDDQDLDFTRASAPIEVNVPASARPGPVSVRYVVPTFGWERQATANMVRSVRYGGGVRVYLDRPWYNSGEGELLGVVLWQSGRAGNAAREAWKPFVTQWGRDPIWHTNPAWPPMPGPEHFPIATAAEDGLRLQESVPADEYGDPGLVRVAGHEVAFDPVRKLWYCDIVLDCPAYGPFVRLALARYQPNALAEAKLSRVVLTDFVQLTPDRSALVSADPYRPRELRLSVTGTAPDGPVPEGPGRAPRRPTNVRVRVQHRATKDHGDFGWQDVDADVARAEVGTTASDAPGVMLWQGRVLFAQAPSAGHFRLVIEEREYVSADHVATSVVNDLHSGERSAPGRVIYAEIITVDDALTLVPPAQATAAIMPGEELPAGGSAPGEEGTTSRVIVQLRGDIDIPYVDGAEQSLVALAGVDWESLLAAFPFLTLNRLFNTADVDDTDAAHCQEAADFGAAWAALDRFFTVLCPPGIDPAPIADALASFTQLFDVVYVERPPALPAINFVDDPLTGDQIYLEPAPQGFDVKFAWTQPGGDGLMVRVADVEGDWDLDHEDLRDASTELVLDPNPIPAANIAEFRNHGTLSAGVLVMADNALGGVGIVPRAKFLAVPAFRDQPDGSTIQDLPNAIRDATKHLAPGDVLLLETQNGDFSPIETDLACFTAIADAVANGIIVIEPAGNGPGNGSLGRHHNLDTFMVPERGYRALSGPPFGLDSGAVMVAACQSGIAPGTTARSPTDYTSRGRRIDCFAYGEHVLSASQPQPLSVPMGPAGRMEHNPHAGRPYSWIFAGTSSASALIAGVAVSVQGLAQSILGQRLTPAQMRQILSDRTLNTPSFAPTTDRIGVMPNLRNITAFLHALRTRGTTVSGNWATVRSGHELVNLSNGRVLDWVPASRTWNVWPYDPMAITGDPLPAPALRSGTWSTIGAGHVLVPFGGDLVLDYVPASGDFRLFDAAWSASDFLPGPARTKGSWATIRDTVVNSVTHEHRLLYLGDNHVLDWVPQDRSFRVWLIDRNRTRQDPLLGIQIAATDGSVHEQPLSEGTFADIGMNEFSRILYIGNNQVLIWHADTGEWRVWLYDRMWQSPQAFTQSPQRGNWAGIRLGHELLWITEPGNGRLLDWHRATGDYRLFSGIPTSA